VASDVQATLELGAGDLRFLRVFRGNSFRFIASLWRCAAISRKSLISKIVLDNSESPTEP
jgi:hypothetical protein